MIKLSVIIPYHNNKKQLLRLLESIPKKYGLEIIVVDDNSFEPLTLNDENYDVTILKNEGKRWAGAARNKGLKYANGKYVIFADSDDFFTNGAFDILESCLSDDYDVFFFNPTSVKDNGEKSGRHLLYSDLVKQYILYGNRDILYKYHAPWSKVFKKSYLIDNDIFFDEVVASNDIVFSVKASLLANSFSVLDKCIYCIVESKDSLTKNRSEFVLDSRYEALRRYNEFLLSIGDRKNLAAMSGHLRVALTFGPRKFFIRLQECLKSGYPLFYSLSHFLRAFRYVKAKRKEYK
ncbi:glycosyltransferase family 2 protein [Salinivibrio kushneri]|uniref:Glycosyltransferase 2-like domain-containing protein n=1 Tax=Salinivibrio kushneri TaxID=1908198 RepID=A0AB36K6Z9_9GAMM|nr:glycosyltransferase family 2 protein [Salinivibrio kushneri]OOE43960.1 hypothetical protein BZG09_09210 [Salinivibrio kushneri]